MRLLYIHIYNKTVYGFQRKPVKHYSFETHFRMRPKREQLPTDVILTRYAKLVQFDKQFSLFSEQNGQSAFVELGTEEYANRSVTLVSVVFDLNER